MPKQKWLLASVLAVIGTACVDDVAPSKTTTVEAQLVSRGFSVDSTRASESYDEVTTIAYGHPDGRAALLLRNTATNGECGAIYDPKTLVATSELAPYAGDIAQSGCSSTWTEFWWSGYTLWQSHCNGETGVVCQTWVGWISPSGGNPTSCESVSCACAGGGGGGYDPSPYP